MAILLGGDGDRPLELLFRDQPSAVTAVIMSLRPGSTATSRCPGQGRWVPLSNSGSAPGGRPEEDPSDFLTTVTEAIIPSVRMKA